MLTHTRICLSILIYICYYSHMHTFMHTFIIIGILCVPGKVLRYARSVQRQLRYPQATETRIEEGSIAHTRHDG